jgi:3-deoxy-manno-octulosonate cytidylyltransferase (CMP-KDO synthetase)
MSSTLNKVIVIPARYQSSRYPGKPLVDVAGTSMLERVWKIAQRVEGISKVIIATDDQRIQSHAQSFGAEVIMTPAELRNGTERAHYAVGLLDQAPDVVINFQGDAVLTPHWILDDLVRTIDNTPDLEMATVAVKLDQAETKSTVEAKLEGELAGVLVVFDRQKNALYFSRSLIPRKRDDDFTSWELHRHIGIYAYTLETLNQYISLSPSPLEEAEQLEQLRALEYGIKIKVALSDYRGRTPASIDTPEDLVKVQDIIAREGELP